MNNLKCIAQFFCTATLFLALSVQGATVTNKTVTYYHNDLLGTPVVTTNGSGNITWEADYKPFGEKAETNSTSGNRIGYTGHMDDAATGLTYMQARYYDPVVGRFYGVDPVGFSAANPHTFNRYAYSNNNPYTYKDPDGKIANFIFGGFSAAVQNVAMQHLEIALGVREEFSYGELTAETALGAATSGLSVIKNAGRLGILAAKLGSKGDEVADVTKGITNPVPGTLARVVPGNVNPKNLGTTADVFVTDAKALQGLNAKQIADKLTIPQSSSGFKVIEFPTPGSGIASPVLRNNPGFVGGGRTAGGAPEFVIPNGPVPAGATTRVVQ